MDNTQYRYGSEVVEFFKYDDEELQALIKQREAQYFRNCMSSAYPDLGVNVSWVNEEPLTVALNELAGWLVQGYTVATSLCRPLYLSVQLKKPATIVDADLLEVAEQAKVDYAASRYTRNIGETKRQIAISVERRTREHAAAAAKVAAEHQATEEARALADLQQAYSPKKASTAK
ncbi:hypothetical protein AEQ67_11150 [Pseudomonas sp. RIT-PI-q]|uniref:hypothetical protein n=1 Tax=Pseudomonas sp. RIT-PI-q TaxID=1690247 RepID=UPI0006CD3B54|nr:hypothetical protein [Pseudomonas sp. RIT-PI-q]KPG99678.1 hypothetical protein AEQ67_11150 [Pseudomonas sp. RIT-PI-q]